MFSLDLILPGTCAKTMASKSKTVTVYEYTNDKKQTCFDNAVISLVPNCPAMPIVPSQVFFCAKNNKHYYTSIEYQHRIDMADKTMQFRIAHYPVTNGNNHMELIAVTPICEVFAEQLQVALPSEYATYHLMLVNATTSQVSFIPCKQTGSVLEWKLTDVQQDAVVFLTMEIGKSNRYKTCTSLSQKKRKRSDETDQVEADDDEEQRPAKKQRIEATFQTADVTEYHAQEASLSSVISNIDDTLDFLAVDVDFWDM